MATPDQPSQMLTSTALRTLFTSLRSRQWSLTRTLSSANPMDIKGELKGSATFTQLPGNDMVYREEGEMPSTAGPMAGLRFTKKYIWRLNEEGIAVWFAKVGEEEADYLFHEFEFRDGEETTTDTEGEGEEPVIVPTPPLVKDTPTVLMARGNHLCIKDMYRTAYAFRIHPETGDVVSWSSRHMVKGPKKNQDIINLYQLSD